jgi:hypothetical protein
MSAASGGGFGGLGSIPDIDTSRYSMEVMLVMADFGYIAAQHFKIVKDQAEGITKRRRAVKVYPEPCAMVKHHSHPNSAPESRWSMIQAEVSMDRARLLARIRPPLDHSSHTVAKLLSLHLNSISIVCKSRIKSSAMHKIFVQSTRVVACNQAGASELL